MIKVTLLPDLPAYGSLSMARYHAELSRALIQYSGHGEVIQEVKFPRHCHVYSKLNNSFLKRWLLRIDRWLTYPALVSGFRSDLFHVLDQSFGQLVFSTRGTPTIVTCHDLIPLKNIRREFSLDYGAFATERYFRVLEGLRKASHIIAVSNATKDDLVNMLQIDPQRISVIYSGLGSAFTRRISAPLPSEKLAQRIQLGLPERGQLILHVGSTAPYKNIKAIVNALPLVLPKEDVWFVMVGAPMKQPDRDLAAKLGVADKILEIGPAFGDTELEKYYIASDLLVFPSISEGFGWPPLEAMSLGTAVVCSTAPALREVVGDAALLIDSDDYGGLAESILSLLGDERLRQTMVTRGLARIAKFDWRKTAVETLAVYHKLT